MRELTKIVIFQEKEILFISGYIMLMFCYTKFEVHCLRIAAPFV